MTATTAPALIDLVEPRSAPPEIARYVYLNDWQGEGDLRCAVIYSPEPANPYYRIVWDATEAAPFGPVNFNTLRACGFWIESLAQQWALAYATPES